MLEGDEVLVITQISIPQIKSALKPLDLSIRRFNDVGLFARIREWLWVRWSYPEAMFGEDIVAKTITIDNENMGELVAEAINALELCLSDVECVIVGPRQAMEADYQHMLKCREFGIELASGSNGPQGILGIRAKIVPWYDGVLVVPRTRA